MKLFSLSPLVGLAPRRAILVGVVLASAVFQSACGSGTAPGPTSEIRDSAGVTIVLNSGPVGPDGGGWSVSPEPELSIGTFAGDSLYQLFQVQGAARLADGRIAIANGGSGELRVYDAEGRFLRSLGRKGEGPGEYQRPALVAVLGSDTLVVVDLPLRRISLVDARGGFVSSATLDDELGGGVFPQGMFRNRTIVLGGGFYWSSSSGDQLSNGYTRRSTSYGSASLDGKLVTDFGEFPGSEFFMRVQTQGGGVAMMARLIPFGKHAMQAVGPDRLFFGSGDSWEVKAYDPAGILKRVIRLDRDLQPVSSADVDARLEEEIADATDPSDAPSIRETFADMPIPDFMPAFAALNADALGYLWIQEYQRPGEDVSTHLILDPEGRLVGRVSLPPNVEVLEIGSDYLLGLYRDELEVEYVRLYALQRP